MDGAKAVATIGLAVLSLTTGGCGYSWMSDRENNPIIKDSTSNAVFAENRRVSIFGTTASRRMVVVLEDAFAEHGKYLTTCAEPSPDVGEAFAAALTAGIRGAADVSQGTDTKIGAELAGQYAKEVTTEIAPLLYRTQGLQLYRDAQFGLCVDRLNGTITSDAEYSALKTDRFNKAVNLIQFELPITAAVQKEYYQSVKAGKAEINMQDLINLVNATKPELIVKQPASAEQ